MLNESAFSLGKNPGALAAMRAACQALSTSVYIVWDHRDSEMGGPPVLRLGLIFSLLLEIY